jgi:CDP-diacylglycerol--glycerol-3-phosphate 3-phosphatidyltransferase
LADKIIYITVIIALIPKGVIPTWLVLVVVTRELFITGLRAMAISEGLVIAASGGGKKKTAFGLVGAIGLIIHYPYEVDFFFVRTTLDFHALGIVLTYLSLFFSLISAIDYMKKFVEKFHENHQAKQRQGSPPPAGTP